MPKCPIDGDVNGNDIKSIGKTNGVKVSPILFVKVLALVSAILSAQSIYICKIAQSFFCVRYLLRNGSTCGDKIWHADPCRPWAGPLLGFMSIGVIVGKKIKVF